MQPRIKRKQAEGVRRLLTRQLAPLGLGRSKPTVWTRPGDLLVPFVHLHSLTFMAGFRVHFGLRVLNDTFPALSLDGPMSEGGFALADRKYRFDFSASEESLVRCAGELASYIGSVGLPWFERYATAQAAHTTDSPLSAEARERLALALAGEADPLAVAASRALLGLP